MSAALRVQTYFFFHFFSFLSFTTAIINNNRGVRSHVDRGNRRHVLVFFLISISLRNSTSGVLRTSAPQTTVPTSRGNRVVIVLRTRPAQQTRTRRIKRRMEETRGTAVFTQTLPSPSRQSSHVPSLDHRAAGKRSFSTRVGSPSPLAASITRVSLLYVDK